MGKYERIAWQQVGITRCRARYISSVHAVRNQERNTHSDRQKIKYQLAKT